MRGAASQVLRSCGDGWSGVWLIEGWEVAEMGGHVKMNILNLCMMTFCIGGELCVSVCGDHLPVYTILLAHIHLYFL